MIIHTKSGAYPVPEIEVKRSFPLTAWPESLFGVDLTEYGFAWVDPVPLPEFDPQTQVVEESDPERTISGYRQVWIVREKTEAEKAAHAIFEGA